MSIHMHADPVIDADRRGDQEALAIERRNAFHVALVADVVKALRTSDVARVYLGGAGQPTTAFDIVREDCDNTNAPLRMLLQVTRDCANGRNAEATRDLALATLNTIATRFADWHTQLLDEQGAFVGDDADIEPEASHDD